VKAVGAAVVFALVALLLRSTALTALAARGVVIDVLAFVTVLWALRERERWGTSFGFLLGLAADLDAAHWLGRHAMMLALIGYATGRLSHSLVRESTRANLVLIAIATLVHQLWVGVFEASDTRAWPYLAMRIVLAVVATAPLGAGVIWALQRVTGGAFLSDATTEREPGV
jgi:rod shape-determining protein MreD